MIKIGLSVFGILGVAVIMFFVIAGIPHSNSRISGFSKIEAVGLPKHGIVLITPSEAAFNPLMSRYLQKSSGFDVGAAKSSSVFVVNKSGRAIAALIVKWELLQQDGQSISHIKAHASNLQAVSDGGPAQLMEDIARDDNQFFSLLDLPNSSDKGIGARTGGGRGIDKARQFSESTKVTISVDGVLFVDGTFVGPDTRGYFQTLKAEIEARRDLFEEVARGLAGDSEAMKRVELLANRKSNGRESAADRQQSTYYDMLQQTTASVIMARRERFGDKAVLESMNAELSKPRVNLRKLED